MMDWGKIKSENYGAYAQAYREFMYNPDNFHQCEACPANIELGGNGQLPCGQYNCWVDCHCN